MLLRVEGVAVVTATFAFSLIGFLLMAMRPELQGHPVVRELNGPAWSEEGDCVTYEEREL